MVQFSVVAVMAQIAAGIVAVADEIVCHMENGMGKQWFLRFFLPCFCRD